MTLKSKAGATEDEYFILVRPRYLVTPAIDPVKCLLTGL